MEVARNSKYVQETSKWSELVAHQLTVDGGGGSQYPGRPRTPGSKRILKKAERRSNQGYGKPINERQEDEHLNRANQHGELEPETP